MRKLLGAYNRQKVGSVGPDATVVFALKDESDGEVRGGLWGEIYWRWLTIYLLFVPEPERGRGVGSELLRKAEAIAQQNACTGAWLDTFSFQEPEFYRKHGYEAFGELSLYPNDAKRIFFRKSLAS